MKIAIYHPWIYLKGGAERVLIEFVKRTKWKCTIYTNYYNEDTTFREFKSLHPVVLTPHSKIKGILTRGLMFSIYAILSKINLDDYDAFLVSTSGIGELIIFRNHSIPSFAYCHTPLRPAHDQQYVKYALSGKTLPYRILYRFLANSYKLLEKPAWDYFEKVFVNSKNVKNRLRGVVKEEKIEVIHPGVDTNFFTPGKEFRKFFLLPGRISKYKNQLLAIKAFKIFKKKIRGFKLIIAGSVESKDVEYYKILKQYENKDSDIKILLNPSDEVLLSLYQNSWAVLFTAVNEDWGLVPLEANACGKLCISVNEGGPRESIINGKNGYLVEPSPEAFAKKMIEIARKDEEFLREKSKKRLKLHLLLKQRWHFLPG